LSTTDFLTIRAAQRLFAEGSLSPVDLARSCIARIERHDHALNSFMLLTTEQALAEAREAELRYRAGRPLSPIDGIPIAHKDIFATAGLRTTACSRWLEHFVPTADADAVSRLRTAGTVLMGKLTTHEFAFGGPSFDLPWPPARNPWNIEHFSGGSSSGTGCAVTAGFIMGGTGSDSGGSIRVPAALSGLTGIKPTFGVCSRRGMLPLSDSLDHAGVLAWTAEDCALLLQQIAGHDALDPSSLDHPVPDFTARLGSSLRGLRVGLLAAYHQEQRPVSRATAEAIEQAAAIFRDLGCTVEVADIPPLAEFQACGYLILLAEAFSVHASRMRRDYFAFGRLMRERLALGAAISADQYILARERQRHLRRAVATAMTDYDVLLTAAVPGEAPRLDRELRWSELGPPNFNMPANVIGFPAMSVPAGFGEGHLPLAIQLIGRPLEEPQLFALADAYQRIAGWTRFRPNLDPPPRQKQLQ
jgi:aspartyl-tRNA(Asn)/glutamyl-tRNA(Gln) amidotransferase subunit A